ncbi:class I SAM-dependent methyltransferase [Acanthopleuribacter pedis]|uniref:Class I SAM-dependent methyltransferase n=1 Tax=Acanthopleuribacter pedis TaxID=442870 RepID=A0A8J7QD31_9BACT|nr:class I SAM-dependent methyltransferase [Acanthopleuribacter pedis]MBO1321909.1 class I SAM-dependent methyltransferase [Acanthopleuribacter pedis]
MSFPSRLLLCVFLTLSTLALAGDPIQKAVDHAERSEKDRERDQREKPAEILKFIGVKPGWTVADIFSSAGYYTELLAHVVGPEGKVIAQNNASYKNYGSKGAALRFTEGRLANVTHLVSEADDLKLPKDGLDMAIMVNCYHDLYWDNGKPSWPAIDAKKFLAQLHAAVKPGGLMVVIDHTAKEGSGSSAAQDLHRIEKAYAEQDFTAAGFTLLKSSDLLRRSGDDHSVNVYDEAIKGKTDRFVLVFQKKS